MIHRGPINAGQHLHLPAVKHARPDGHEIGGREYEQHLQRFGRTDLDGKANDQLRIAGVAAKRQVRHLQMFVYEELQRLSIGFRQPETLTDLLRDVAADVAMIFGKALAQVVNQQGQMQKPLALDAPVDAPSGPLSCQKFVAASTAPGSARRPCTCDIR